MAHITIYIRIANDDVLLNADETATVDIRLHMYQCSPGSVTLSVCDTKNQLIDAKKDTTVIHKLSIMSEIYSCVKNIRPTKIRTDHPATHSRILVYFATPSYIKSAAPNIIKAMDVPNTDVRAMGDIPKCVMKVYEKIRDHRRETQMIE